MSNQFTELNPGSGGSIMDETGVTYGTIRPADVSPEDVEIILNYTPSRDETDNFVLTTLVSDNAKIQIIMNPQVIIGDYFSGSL